MQRMNEMDASLYPIALKPCISITGKKRKKLAILFWQAFFVTRYCFALDLSNLLLIIPLIRQGGYRAILIIDVYPHSWSGSNIHVYTVKPHLKRKERPLC